MNSDLSNAMNDLNREAESMSERDQLIIATTIFSAMSFTMAGRAERLKEFVRAMQDEQSAMFAARRN